MAPKKAGAAGRAPAAPELYDDDVQASEDSDVISDDGMLGLDEIAGFGDEGQGDSADDEGELHDEKDQRDGDMPSSERLKEAARRQMPAGPGPQSTATAAAAGKVGGLVADTALMLQPETSDAAILQIEADELLAETRANYSRGSSLEAVISRLKDALLSMPEHEVPLSIAKGFMEALGLPAKDSLTIKPPTAVTLVGSYCTRSIARPNITVDIAVQLPADFLVPKAHLNYRYHAHRAVYLLAVARHLRDVSYSLFGEQRLEALHGDPARPALLLQPPKAEGHTLRLLPSIAPATFALPRLAPDRNGVRAHCKAAASKTSAGSAASAVEGANDGGPGGQQGQQPQLLPTPHYNAGILEDMLLPVHANRLKDVLSSSPRLLDGLLLLKVWARQQGLMVAAAPPTRTADLTSPATAAAAVGASGFGAVGSGCLDGCVLAMLVLLLAERNKLAATAMTVLQVFRGALQLLSDTAAWSKGLSLGRMEEGAAKAAGLGLPPGQSPPLMQTYKAHHQVVFVDFTGWLNVAAHMTRGSLAHAQLVARRTLDLLNAPADPDEAFAAAFLTAASPAAAFDYHWRVNLPAGASWPAAEAGRRDASTATAADDAAGGGGAGVLCRDRVLWRDQEVQIEQLVRQGLSDRAKVVRVLRRPLSNTSVPDDLAQGLVPLAAGEGAGATAAMWVGALLDPLAASRLVDVGPSADDGPAAARFRRFWGDKSELRRWQDGKITETAVWEVPPHRRHVIPDLILEHVVARHLPAGSSVVGAAPSLDWALTCKALPSGADLAASRAAEAAAEKLGKQLRALDGMALKVIGVQPLSAVSRGTAPLPPQPHPLAGGSAAGPAAAVEAGAGGGGGLARCLDPLEVLVTLENSGRWPDDPTAFRKMKAALGLQLAGALASSYGLHVSASEEAVDVLLDGFAFRLVLYSGRDEAMLTKAAAVTTTTMASATSAAPTAGSAAAAAAAASVGLGVGLGLLSPEESPLLLTWHHGLVSLVAGANAAYAPAARLAGRWVAAHMMSNHVGPQVVELLVAAAFGGSGAPAARAPGSRVTGFLRFLQLVARWPWQLKPLVVDPAREIMEADRRALRSRFEARRAAGDAPALYICTARDRESRHWTHRGPSAAALQRLVVLAARSAAVLQLLLQPPAAAAGPGVADSAPAVSKTPSGLPAEWPSVFSTPAADFDAFVLLRKEALPHADLALMPPAAPRHAARDAVRHPRGGKGHGWGSNGAAMALSLMVLAPGTAVKDLLHGGSAAAADAPASGSDALSYALEEGEAEPPPKRARAFLRCFHGKVAAKGAARLQPELLVGFDPMTRLVSELTVGYGHLATFCVDELGGRLVGVRWEPNAFLPQPLRLNTAHTALPLTLTGSTRPGGAGQEKKDKGSGEVLCVPNVLLVLREVKELGLGIVDDWLMPPSSAKARAVW